VRHSHASLQRVHEEVVVEQVILRQQQEIGFLEDITNSQLSCPTRNRLPRSASGRREQSVAICGLAGMGKSTLAAHFAREYSQQHPVSWIRWKRA
jgi:signal recognition particle GTPase